MRTYLIDSDILIDFLNGKQRRDRLFEKLVKDNGELACCAINVTEIFSGISPQKEHLADRLFSAMTFVGVNARVARRAGLIRRDLARKGIAMSLADATIAALTIEEELVLVTGNARDFSKVEVKLYPLPRLN